MNNIDENGVFDEVSFLKRYANEEKIICWNSKNIVSDKKWVELPYISISQIVEYILSLPETNAATERVFSAVNNLWTSEKNKSHVETLKCILSVKYNITNCCEEFLKFPVKILNF
jgi:hypothetical protein